jgi:hypothetical protein
MIFPLKNRQKWGDTDLHPFPFSSSLSIEAWAIAQAHGSVGGGKSLVLITHRNHGAHQTRNG